jgi:hypothetical protein
MARGHLCPRPLIFKLKHEGYDNHCKKEHYGLDFSQNDVIIEIINKGSFLIGKPVSF